jgi:amino acid transporter
MVVAGYEQPFYVLAQFKRPQRTFAWATTAAMVTTMVLYPLLNVSYLCMTPYEGNESLINNLGLAGFARLAGQSPHEPGSAVTRVAAGFQACFILGNLLAQTYTASRVKQEIAREGILPKSLLLGRSDLTILARIFGTKSSSPQGLNAENDDGLANNDTRERAPIAATIILHCGFEMLLVIIFGSLLGPSQAYNFLTYVYTYSIVGVLGLLTLGGLLYLKLDSYINGSDGREWTKIAARRKPYFDPLPALVGFIGLAVLLFAAFVRPSVSKPNELQWYVAPAAGWGAVLLGAVWWAGIRLWERYSYTKLTVRRLPLIYADKDGDPVQTGLVIEHDWVDDSHKGPGLRLRMRRNHGRQFDDNLSIS